MKKTISLIAALIFGAVLSAEDFTKGSDLIPLSIVPSEQEGISPAVQNAMKDKLMQIVAANGLGNSETLSRFVITSSISETSKDFVAGPPKQVSVLYDFTLYIVDNIDHNVFSTASFDVRAIDYSEEKAMLRALRQFRVKNSGISSFVKVGKEKIVNYYNSQIDNIINKARLCASQRNYEEAFYLLVSVPEACPAAYTKAINVGNEINRKWIDYQGEKLLSAAKAAWAAEQNSTGATKAGEYLSQIDPEAACRPQAEALYNEIKSKVYEDWKFEMKMYQDTVNLEKMRIEAWKNVGVAYGNHQPKENYHLNWLIR